MPTETLKSDARISGINTDEIADNIWSAIYRILTTNSTVAAYSANVYSAYTSQFLEDGSGTPFIIIHRPQIVESFLQLNQDTEDEVNIDIDIVSNSAREVRKLQSAVRAAIKSEKDGILANHYLFDPRVINHGEEWELLDNKKLHYDFITYSFNFHNRGA